MNVLVAAATVWVALVWLATAGIAFWAPTVLLEMARCGSLALFAVSLALVASGISGAHALHVELYRGATIGIWHLVPAMILVPLLRARRTRRYAPLGVAGASAACWILFMLAGFTGYLGPSHAGNESLGTVFRFRLLHLCAVPWLFSLVLLFVTWRLGRYASIATREDRT